MSASSGSAGGKPVMDATAAINDELNRVVAQIWEAEGKLRRLKAQERMLRRQLGKAESSL